MGVAKHWHRLPREVVESPSLEFFDMFGLDNSHKSVYAYKKGGWRLDLTGEVMPCEGSWNQVTLLTSQFTQVDNSSPVEFTGTLAIQLVCACLAEKRQPTCSAADRLEGLPPEREEQLSLAARLRHGITVPPLPVLNLQDAAGTDILFEFKKGPDRLMEEKLIEDCHVQRTQEETESKAILKSERTTFTAFHFLVHSARVILGVAPVPQEAQGPGRPEGKTNHLGPVFALFVPFYSSIPRVQVTQVLGHFSITNKTLVYILGLQ
ncbi:hypothetical protein QYF61_020624, partial [Mycteria americana]